MTQNLIEYRHVECCYFVLRGIKVKIQYVFGSSFTKKRKKRKKQTKK